MFFSNIWLSSKGDLVGPNIFHKKGFSKLISPGFIGKILKYYELLPLLYPIKL